MAKSISYYKKRQELYKNLAEYIKPFSDYFTLKERLSAREMIYAKEFQKFNTIFSHIYKVLLEYMDILELFTVEDIFAYSVFLLHMGYLYYEKDLKTDCHNFGIYELSILSPLALNAHASCRHIASLTSDLENARHHESYILAVNRRKAREIAVDNKSVESNHGITVTTDENYTYLLDPTNNEVYGIEIDGAYYSSTLNSIRIEKSELINIKNKIFYEIKSNKPLKDPNECEENIIKSLSFIQNNLDILESLYREINPALRDAEDIYQKILRS